MTRNKKYIISSIAVLILVISAGYYVYTEIVAKSFRYDSPTESFEKTGPKKAELLDIFEDKDVALVTFRKKDGVLSYQVVAKDNRGWTPMTVVYWDKRHIVKSKNIFNINEVQGKYVVIAMIGDINGKPVPFITDSLESIFFIGTYDTNGGGKLSYAFLVSEEAFPEDYTIIVGDEEIAMY